MDAKAEAEELVLVLLPEEDELHSRRLRVNLRACLYLCHDLPPGRTPRQHFSLGLLAPSLPISLGCSYFGLQVQL